MSASMALNRQGIVDERDARALRVDHLPFYYSVHLNMPCNQRCIMCVPNFQHARDVLPLEQFVAFFDQVKPYAEHITLIGGETFMYPWIEEVLALLSEYEIAVTIHTNGFMLNERVTPGLLDLHELYLKLSIDAAMRETYRRIHGRDHFDRVTSNMLGFAELARDKPGTNVIPHYVVMRENLHEVVPFIDFAKQLHPQRVEFDPVRHVEEWRVENGTGWRFDGKEQSCQFFADEYNEVMGQAAARCESEGLGHEVHFL
jgi:MoaA/NifB/PqqE/SkfB family radical SAM enzyme